MISPQDYRQFAMDCARWAEATANASHRQILQDMAWHWLKIAMEIEGAAPLAIDERRLSTLLKKYLD
jgi:hypothetical protein